MQPNDDSKKADETNILTFEDSNGITIKIHLSRADLYWFSENQIQMIHVANGKPLIDQLRIIFIMLLEVLSRGK